MASRQEDRKQIRRAQEEGGQGHGRQEPMNLEEIGKYRAEAQQRSADAIRAAEERFHRANQPGAATAGSYQEATKQPAGSVDRGSLGEQWLADAARDATERCNRALGTSPAAAPHGNTEASRGEEAKKPPSAQAGGQDRGHFTRQEEMGRHDGEAHERSAAEAVHAAGEKHDKGDESRSAADHAMDAGAHGARPTAEKTEAATGSAVDSAKHAAAKVKDVSASAAGATVGYAKQAAAKTKDVTLSTGGTAAEYARAAAEKTREAAVAAGKTTAGYTQQAAAKAKDATVATGAQVAHKAMEVTAGTAHKVAEYAREKAEQGKESAARVADKAKEPGSGAAAQAEDSTADTARRPGGAAEEIKNKVKDATESMAR